jgi:hypothetical protein
MADTPLTEDPSEEYCILCGGPCRETALWALASKKLGEQMDRLLEEMDRKA